MKKLYTLLLAMIITSLSFAQTPDKMSYQAVIRNGSGQLITSTNIGMQISILQGAIDGEAIYVERHFPTTNESGLVTIEIGAGTIVTGSFSVIDWSNGMYFIKIETDPQGGANYTIAGTSQLLSVPYAMHSKSSDILTGEITESQISDLQNYLKTETDPTWSGTANQTGYIGRTGNVGIGTNTPTQKLDVNGNSFFRSSVGIGVSNSDTSIPLKIRSGSTLRTAIFLENTTAEDYSIQTVGSGVAGREGNFEIWRIGGSALLTIRPSGSIGIGTSSPAAKLDINGTTRLGPGGTSFSEIREITGTTHATLDQVGISYPPGYNKSNTRVLSLEINILAGHWVGIGLKAYNMERTLHYSLWDQVINVSYPGFDQYLNRPLRMILMKM